MFLRIPYRPWRVGGDALMSNPEPEQLTRLASETGLPYSARPFLLDGESRQLIVLTRLMLAFNM